VTDRNGHTVPPFPEDRVDALLAARDWAVAVSDSILVYLIDAALLHINETYVANAQALNS
jgi:hypothetical protein